MKNKIESVRIEKIPDTDPDTSYLGDYSNSPKNPYSIDRQERGDMGRNELRYFNPVASNWAGELLSALQTFEECGKTAELTAIYCDSMAQGVEVLTPFDTPKPKGGGGTDFKPPFDYIEANNLNPIAVVYMTDGFCSSFPEMQSYPVLWAVIGNYSTFKPPFGEVLLMDIES